MSRKRDLSSDISIDTKIAELSEHGFLPVTLYMMAIPQADDWGRLPGSPREFKMLVCPGFDVTVAQVAEALKQIANLGLWTQYQVGEKHCIGFPPEAWFKRQSYINIGKRHDDSGSSLPPSAEYKQYVAENSKEQQKTARNSNVSGNTGSPSKQQGTAENSKEQQKTARNSNVSGNTGSPSKQQGTAENSKEQHNPSPSPSPSPSNKIMKESERAREGASDFSLRDSQEPEQETGPGHTEPPTVEMVRVRFMAIGWPVEDAQRFLDDHQRGFWCHNKASPENWEYCSRLWVAEQRRLKSESDIKLKTLLSKAPREEPDIDAMISEFHAAVAEGGN